MFWQGPCRTGFNYERKEPVLLFNVAKSRKERRQGEIVELSRQEILEYGKKNPAMIIHEKALEVAKKRGWA